MLRSLASAESLINHLAASTDALEDKMMIGIELEEEFEDEPDMMLKLGTLL